ncbi:hypothetical protein MNEG_2156 [Monoraphidium neglectum]|uniref:Uncharacterized protein n=1 Tax=Monoraphidium neglectum TaxID=145388 RepID=A0A0D2MZS5_9CHLO|nr:hypothetical protein MNEG_2156 [Monoraphidium neglectum]KIZ05802.1 hypothetical protein MNEG_2156 [Monoraphidium neglectum]|eukprot:XP_013904821.1 hypothetical protein MNEG_2156 [Monoraphidium neglectum]
MLHAISQGPGHLEAYVNSRKLSASPRVHALRSAVSAVTQRQFPGGHAQVQLQGSTYMAVALEGLSDADFFVRMDDTIPAVTRAQRVKFVSDLQSTLPRYGLVYPQPLELRESRIRSAAGMYMGAPAPPFDVLFERFASQKPRRQPARRPLAGEVQLVVCALRLMPLHFTNLVQPQSSALIDWVEGEWRRLPAARSSEHRKAFGQLLKWALDLLAGAAGKLPPKTFVVALQRKNKHFGDQQLAAAARDWGHAAR